MKRKGFTLVELLAVIAILAILVIIALPNVLKIFRDSKENIFVEEVQNIIKASQTEFISSSLSNQKSLCFDSVTRPLNLNGNKKNYYIELTEEGNIKNLIVTDNDYQISILDNDETIKIDQIGNKNSNKDYKISDFDNNTIVLTCEEVEKDNNKSVLKALDNPFVSDERTDFLGTSLDKTKIKTIVFTDSNIVPESVVDSADVSQDGNGNIMMWWTDTEDGMYDVTIGEEGGVRLNPNSSYLFYNLYNVESIDLSKVDSSKLTNMYAMFVHCDKLKDINFENIDTSKVTSMDWMFSFTAVENLDLRMFRTSKVQRMDRMFAGCVNLRNLNVSSFDTSLVNNMTGMFIGDTSLETLDLSNFDTRNVTEMFSMFEGCTSLSNLNLENFTINDGIDISCMFKNTDKLDLSTTKLKNYQNLTERLACDH